MKRIVELDIIKALAIIMVVIGHAACTTIIGQMFYLIHVPLFFMVSGYTCKDDSEFCSKSSLSIFFLKRIRTLYVPFFKYILPLVLLHNVFYAVSVFPLAVLPVALQKKLQKMGKRTMIIFCWHYIAFLLLSSIYIFLTNGDLHLIAKSLRIPNISWWCFSIFGIFIPYYIYSFKSYVIINSNFSESAK